MQNNTINRNSDRSCTVFHVVCYLVCSLKTSSVCFHIWFCDGQRRHTTNLPRFILCFAFRIRLRWNIARTTNVCTPTLAYVVFYIVFSVWITHAICVRLSCFWDNVKYVMMMLASRWCDHIFTSVYSSSIHSGIVSYTHAHSFLVHLQIVDTEYWIFAAQCTLERISFQGILLTSSCRVMF